MLFPEHTYMIGKTNPFFLRSVVVTSFSLLVLGSALYLPSPAFAQGIVDLTTWQPDHAVTTSIKDALPPVTYLKGYSETLVKPIPDDWTFAPGYYRSVVRSYCLHAGAYGPTKGDGYLIASLKGDRVPVIRDILLRSVSFPNIDQRDVQRLVWGIEDGAQWDNYDNEFKTRVAPLLSTEEIAVLNLEPQRANVVDKVRRGLGGLIPGKAQKMVDNYAELRNKITGTSNYEELEKVAVKTGVAPWGKDSRKDILESPWAYVGDGFYMRAFPTGYPTTTLEIYRVAPAKLTKDEKGRITRFDSDGYIIDTAYSEEPATENITGKSTRVWRFKTVTFRHPDGRTATIENRGYIVAGTDERRFQVASLKGMAVRHQDDGGLGDLQHYKDGLDKASDPTDLKGKFDWISDHLSRVGAAWDAASAALAGNTSTDPTPKKFDPSRFAAAPANTSRQRLALSGFKKK